MSAISDKRFQANLYLSFRNILPMYHKGIDKLADGDLEEVQEHNNRLYMSLFHIN